jgi:hypothetical protein
MVCHHLNVGANAKLAKELLLLITIKSKLVVTTLTLGLRLKQRHGKVPTKNVTRELHLHSHECEGMNPHTPQWIPTLGAGIFMESQVFKGVFQGSKLTGLNSSLYHLKVLEM